MATKKAAKKSSKKSAKKSSKKSSRTSSKGLSNLLAFKIDWIKDPMPDLRRFLDRDAIRQLDALKGEFGRRVSAILKSGQR